MSVIFLVLPLALIVVLAAVGAFAWAARRGQFDDLTTPAWRVLHEDEGPTARAEKEEAPEPEEGLPKGGAGAGKEESR